MKTMLLAGLICGSILVAEGVVRGGEPEPQEALIALERQSWEAWKNGDGAFFLGFLSDDHVEVGALYLKRNGRWQNALYQQTQAPKKGD